MGIAISFCLTNRRKVMNINHNSYMPKPLMKARENIQRVSQYLKTADIWDNAVLGSLIRRIEFFSQSKARRRSSMLKQHSENKELAYRTLLLIAADLRANATNEHDAIKQPNTSAENITNIVSTTRYLKRECCDI
ncbi:hypothetical protein [Cysteiniphilum marinum]|uniref:hypothetical protein n=4 Tax=Cysteiniphilum marinum TaxID=2774191 RepID=UPI00193ADA31|nr:hypothetical protein [Cysteiniphilum marinum]